MIFASITSKQYHLLLLTKNEHDAVFFRECLRTFNKFIIHHELFDYIWTRQHSEFASIDIILLTVTPETSQIQDYIRDLKAMFPNTAIVLVGDEGNSVQALSREIQDYLIRETTNAQVLIRSLCYAIERQQNEELSRLLSRQEAYVQQINRLLTDLANYIKTPISVILTTVYLLVKAETLEHRQKHADRVRKQITEIKHSFEPVLDLDELNQVSFLQVRSVNIKSSLKRLQNRFSQSNVYSKIQLQIDIQEPLPFVLANEYWLIQAMRYLLDNTVNAIHKHGIIILRAYNSNSYTIIEISHSGTGISEKDLPHIFERYYSIGKSQPKNGISLGIGLTIVHKIIELHKGSIEVESEANVGTTFRIKLPIVDH